MLAIHHISTRKIPRIGRLLVATMAIAGIAAGCQSASNSTASPHPSVSRITVIDDTGHRITLPHPATRIVTLEPSNTEIALDLGLKSRLVGVDQQSMQYAPPPWNQEMTGLHSIGTSYPAVSAEMIAAAHPNLVIAYTGIGGLTNLAHLGIPVVTLDPQSVNGVYHDIQIIGTLTGTQARAQKVISTLKHQIQSLAQAAQSTKTRPRVFYDLGQLYTVGNHTFLNSLITMAGAQNIGSRLSSLPWPQTTPEAVVAANPNIILVDPDATTVAQVKKLPGFQAIAAITQHRVYAVPNSSYINEPSPAMAMGLRELITLIHPGLHP